jgi:hypothetical protein
MKGEKIIDTALFGMEEVIDFRKMERDAFVDLRKDVKPPPIALSMGEYTMGQQQYEIPFATYGNFSCLIGQSKSMKTFFKSALVAAYIGGKANNYFPNMKGHDTAGKFVIDIDTEQSLWHTQHVARRTTQMVGAIPDFYKPYSTRRWDAKTRFQFLEWICMESDFKDNLGLVIVDGAADITDSVNDLDTANKIVQGMLTWTELRKCHLSTVLHMNWGSDKATGHLGSAIMKKSETVAGVQKDDFNVVTVTPNYCRNRSFDKFQFRLNEWDLPLLDELDKEEDNPF